MYKVLIASWGDIESKTSILNFYHSMLEATSNVGRKGDFANDKYPD